MQIHICAYLCPAYISVADCEVQQLLGTCTVDKAGFNASKPHTQVGPGLLIMCVWMVVTNTRNCCQY